MASFTPQLGAFKVPAIENEPMRNYGPNSAERAGLVAALTEMRAKMPFTVPCVVNGEPIETGNIASQPNPSDRATSLCNFHQADAALVQKAIKGALEAKKSWEAMPWTDRAAVYLKAADLIAGKYRYKLMAATMLGQGKNAWQAEIDAAAETCDFFRFNVQYCEQLYSSQPGKNAPGVWNRMEYRALEGFVLAVSPFNFTAIGGNLPGVPALVGNVVLWKPSPMAVYSNYVLYEILVEAGLPAGVIQFIPGPAEEIVGEAIGHRHFSGLHFTGSTAVFKTLWKQIAQNLDKYRGYPRIVGETGGKNFFMVHKSAKVTDTVQQAIRGAFEYNGQKCSALSRLYVPASLWEKGGFKVQLLEGISKIKVGPVDDFRNFMGPVIAQHSFDKILGLIEAAKKDGGEILAGGTGDNSKGWFIQPTVILTKDPKSVTMVNEIFGPVLTVFVYDDDKFEETCELIDSTTDYALTGSIFAQDRQAIVTASNLLRNASGMFYINDKCTGAIVGQQPFGGARGSGTNDKAGSMSILYRFVSARTIKENFLPVPEYSYPSNLV